MRRRFWSLFTTVLFLSLLAPALASADAGSVRFSYEKIEVGSSVQWALVPHPVKKMRGEITRTTVEDAFDALKRNKRTTYLKSTISVSGRVPARARVIVKIDPKAAPYAPIIMAETVYTLTELGVPEVRFPGHASGGLERSDIPFSAYSLTVPLWRAVPDLDSSHAQVLMPDGELLPSTEVHDRWRRKDDKLIAAYFDYLDAKVTYTVNAALKKLKKLDLPLADEVVPLLRHDSDTVKKTALDILSEERNNEKVLNAVLKMMNDEKGGLAREAANFLGEARSSRFNVQKLFFLLERGSQAEAIEAAKKLGKRKDDRIVGRLVKKLDGKHLAVARAAAEALSELNATDAQMNALEDGDIEMKVRLQIARDLAEDRDKGARLAGNLFIAQHAGEVEGKRAVAAIGGLKTGAAREALEDMLGAKTDYLQAAAAEELANLKKAESLPAFARAMRSDEDNREALEDAGYEIMAAQALDVVMKQTKDGNKYIRRMAYRALGERARKAGAGSRAFKVLEEGLSKRDPMIRGAAARAIGSYGNKKAASALESVIDDKNSAVRRDVALALGDFDDGEHTDALKKYLEDDSPEVVAAAIASLEKRREAFAWDKIKELAKSKNPGVRANALQALATLVSRDDRQGVRQVVSMLSGAVTDSNQHVQTTALKQLGRFDEESAVTAIAIQLNTDEENVRLASIRALGKTGHAKAAELVESVLADPNPKVRRAAIESLGELGGAAAKSALKSRLKKEKDPHLQELIEKTLRKL